MGAWPNLRREPFRLFFPLGATLGLAGMLPWFLFLRGHLQTWPGTYHALTMTQAFLGSLVVGFLGTMLPRRLKARPFSVLELLLLLAGLIAIPLCAMRQQLWLAEASFLLVLVTLTQFAIRSARQAPAGDPVPPSHVLLPFAMLVGIAGASLLIAYDRGGGAAWKLAVGRNLVQQGFVTGLVMALAHMLIPIISSGQPPPRLPAEHVARARVLHLLAGLVFVGTFVLEALEHAKLAHLVRAAVVAAELTSSGALGPIPLPGLHRRLFRLALLFIPLGFFVAGLAPVARVPSLHLTFVGGFGLLAFSVSVHVTLLHTGREHVAMGRPPLVAIAALLMLAALVFRVGADRFPRHYFGALTVASSLWLGAGVAWLLFLLVQRAGKSTASSARRGVGPSTGGP